MAPVLMWTIQSMRVIPNNTQPGTIQLGVTYGISVQEDGASAISQAILAAWDQYPRKYGWDVQTGTFQYRVFEPPMPTVVWIGSYQNPEDDDKSFEVARWTADAAMAAMQALYDPDGKKDTLEFAQATLPDDTLTGYAPGLDRWEADVSRQMADGSRSIEMIYIEPFLVESAPPIRRVEEETRSRDT